MPQVPGYQNKLTPTAETSFVPQSAELINQTQTIAPTLGVAKQVADLTVEVANKMREADHAANAIKIQSDLASAQLSLKEEFTQDPNDHANHVAKYNERMQQTKEQLLGGISDPVSRNQLAQYVDRTINDNRLDIQHLSTTQRIDINKSIYYSSASKKYAAGLWEEGNQIIAEGMGVGYFTHVEGQSIIDSKTKESRLNVIKSMIAADPANTRAIALDPANGLNPADTVEMIKLGNQLVFEDDRIRKINQEKADEEIEDKLAGFLINKDVTGGSNYLKSVVGRLSNYKTLQYTKLFQSSEFATDMTYYNSLFDRTASGANTRNEILGTRRIAEDDKAELLRIFYSSHGAGGKKSDSDAMVSNKQLFNKQIGFANDYLKANIITTGPLAQFVKQDEQVTLANAERSTYYAALSGQDPVEYANKLVSHMNKSRKIHTRYGTIVDRNSYEATGRQAVRDRKAGKLNDAEWLNIQESMKMARDLQNF